MHYKEILGLLSIPNKTTFYRITQRLGIVARNGEYTGEQVYAIEAEFQRRRPIKYRVSVKRGPYYVIKHVNLTKKQAIDLYKKYRKVGIKVAVISCDKENRRLL